MSRAVVLSGGGRAGAAWMLGPAAGLREAGVDLAAADLIVGTSGGARTGAQLATGTADQAVAAYRAQGLPAVMTYAGLPLTRVGCGRPFGGENGQGRRAVSMHLRAGLASLVHVEGRPAELARKARVRRGTRMSAEAVEMVAIPRAELEALKAELRRLRREVGRGIARARIQADPGPGGDALTFTREPLRWTAARRSPRC